MKLTYLFPLCMSVFIVSCSSNSPFSSNDSAASGEDYLQPVQQEVDPISPLTLRVVGYGIADSRRYSPVQRKLMAVRASKVDAYRALAERLYGFQVNGETTVRDMAVKDDRFNTMIQAYINGGRIVSADMMPDGSVETVMEVIIDQGFRNCLQMVSNKRMNVDCRASMRTVIDKGDSISSIQKRRVREQPASNENSFYFID